MRKAYKKTWSAWSLFELQNCRTVQTTPEDLLEMHAHPISLSSYGNQLHQCIDLLLNKLANIISSIRLKVVYYLLGKMYRTYHPVIYQ